jgi:hypothetical protein
LVAGEIDKGRNAMASWADLRQYIQANYKISEDQDTMLHMVFNSRDGRSQIVTVSYARLNNEEDWVKVDSPIGKFDEVNLSEAVRRAGGLTCGAISSIGDWVTLRDSFPLENLDINEFEAPLGLITGTADELERDLVGGDRV